MHVALRRREALMPREFLNRSCRVRLRLAQVNAEMRTSFVGHHTSATFELRAVVNAEARRVERSRALTTPSTAPC